MTEMPKNDIDRLADEVAKLIAHRFVIIHNSILRLIRFQFLRCLFFGLGSVVGATVVVSLLVYGLSQVDFVPILGDWAKALADELQLDRGATQ